MRCSAPKKVSRSTPRSAISVRGRFHFPLFPQRAWRREISRARAKRRGERGDVDANSDDAAIDRAPLDNVHPLAGRQFDDANVRFGAVVFLAADARLLGGGGGFVRGALAQEVIAEAEVRGAVWNARNVSERAVAARERCRVVAVNGLELDIRPE